MISSRTSDCVEQTPHPSSGTSSSRLESWHPIDLDSVPPSHGYLGENLLILRLAVTDLRYSQAESSPEFYATQKLASIDSQAESSAGFNATQKLTPLLSPLIWRALNIPAVRSPYLPDGGEQILYLTCPVLLQSSPINRVCCVGVEAISC